jgi:dipeptidyl aminopeptidase/acylaminoacyl peptidase
MKCFVLYLVLILCADPTLSQDLISNVERLSSRFNKPYIDSSAIKTWPHLWNKPSISNDGRFIQYFIGNQPTGSTTLVVQDADNTWKKEFLGVNDAFFSSNNKLLIFLKNDTLFFLELGKEIAKYIPSVSSFKFAKLSKAEWVAYQLDNSHKELILHNLISEKEFHYNFVTDYYFADNGNALLTKTEIKQETTLSRSLNWISLKDVNLNTVWSATSTLDLEYTIDNYMVDVEGKRMAFLISEKKDKIIQHSLWYFEEGMEKAVMKLNDQFLKYMPNSYMYTAYPGYPKFSKIGKYIYFWVVQPQTETTSPNKASVDIWSYKDSVLQSTQLLQNGPVYFYMAINIDNNKVTQITRTDESYYNQTNSGDFIIVSDNSSINDFWWKLTSGPSYYLYSLKDGSRKLLDADREGVFSFSPKERYLVYFDTKLNNYFSYDLRTEKKNNISKTIQVSLSKEYIKGGLRGHPSRPFGIAGWLEDDSTILVYDEYDIWQVDPKGIILPVNITNGFGRKNSIKFRLLYEGEYIKDGIIDKKYLLLTAFDTKRKYNGIYHKSLTKKGDPEVLNLGPYRLYISKTQVTDWEGKGGIIPLKAKDTSCWVVLRQTATEAPNYFLTFDFKNFKAISDIKPQRRFNWITSELVNWKQLDGTECQGILYKPEDFDAQKKYPIIFSYYQTKSDLLYSFQEPDFTNTDINIPWFVSRGYLVFTPDIHYIVGKPGQSAVNSVVSAAKYLSLFPYINKNKIALTGHSFGGFETNYLVTHSNLFAAAASSAGTTDFISAYAGLTGKNFKEISRMNHTEVGQSRIGAHLWERPDLYLENSPILKADKVVTPILIMHNKKDESVPWMQAVELFTSLRRLGKKAWMLQYDDGGHGVGGKDAVDYTIRLTQFFDHYLKEERAPKWMTQGIPAKLKAIDSRYELDYEGSCGDNCTVCKKYRLSNLLPPKNK